MFLFNRKTLAAIGAAAAMTTLFAAPAQAAGTGKAEVVGKNGSIVRYTARAGQVNNLVITISGRTITLQDRVAIKAGKGCQPVRKGDWTKVRCTTSRKPTELSVLLGDRSDKVTNKTWVSMAAEGGSGNDFLIGGSGADRLLGDTGNDTIFGGAGNDVIDGGSGNDDLQGGAGNDLVYGRAGHDALEGGPGRDRLYGGAGIDGLVGGVLDGDAPDSGDWLYGGTGNDFLTGGTGNDYLHGGLGDDHLIGGPGKDKLIGGGGRDHLTQGW